MKIGPTLEGGLRLDLDTPLDWLMLQCLCADASGQQSSSLADRLGEYMQDKPGAGDWQEFVLPDLRTLFEGQISTVAEALKAAALKSGEDGPGEVVIHPADGESWFGALNQARMALADLHGLTGDEDPRRLPSEKGMAWYRYQFYGLLQRQLLDHVMR